jgi:hypothetical protein
VVIVFEPVQEDAAQSPDSRALADYEEYCRRELPRDFRAALEEIVHNESQPIEESIRSQLMNIIRDCQDRVFSRYRASATSAIRTPSRSVMRTPSPSARSSARERSMPDTSPSMNMSFTNTSETGLLAFFHPPPPQPHFESSLDPRRVEPMLHSDSSDSGYTSQSLAPRSTPLCRSDDTWLASFEPSMLEGVDWTPYVITEPPSGPGGSP